MSIFKKGTVTVASGGTAQSLVLGFVPNWFRMVNSTKIIANTNAVQIVEWYNDMVNGSAYLWTTSSGVPTISYISSNGITPLQTADSALFPASNLTITGISNAAQASITATHAFTNNDVGVTVVSFHGVKGMTQINTLSGTVQSITSTTSFTVNINSTGFSSYTSGGIANIVTGIPALQGGPVTPPSGGIQNALGFSPLQASTNQVLNTALFNAGVIGLTLGSSVMVNTSDVWEYTAFLDAPFQS